MPTLNWTGKEKVVMHHLDVPIHALEFSYGFSAENGQEIKPTDSGNIIIHGDNLIALKALMPKYEGRVDCIYIDPPYNTGKKLWVYNDNVDDPHIMKYYGIAYYFFYEPGESMVFGPELLPLIKEKAEAYIIYAEGNTMADEWLLKYHITFKRGHANVTSAKLHI